MPRSVSPPDNWTVVLTPPVAVAAPPVPPQVAVKPVAVNQAPCTMARVNSTTVRAGQLNTIRVRVAQRRRRHDGQDHAAGRQEGVTREDRQERHRDLPGAADEVRHGQDRGRGMLRRRATVRQAGTPGRLADERRGSPADVLKNRSAVLGAVAIALIAAAPARAAKIENLQQAGQASRTSRSSRRPCRAKQEPKTTAKTVGKLTLKTRRGHRRPRARARPHDRQPGPRLAEGAAPDPAQRHHRAGCQESALSELQPVDTLDQGVHQDLQGHA